MCVEGRCLNPPREDGDSKDWDDPDLDINEEEDTSCLTGFAWNPFLQKCVLETSDEDRYEADESSSTPDEEEKETEIEGEETCIPASHASFECHSGDVYWLDSCGDREEKKESCGQGCLFNECRSPLECANGICFDPSSGLHWQMSPGFGSPQDAALNCTMIGSGWRLPNISELRTLVRFCEEIEIGGICNIKDLCTSCGIGEEDVCVDFFLCGGACSPTSCPDDGGPGINHCYWMEELGGDCSLSYISSSTFDFSFGTTVTYYLGIDFLKGNLVSMLLNNYGNWRCVR